MPVTWTIRDEFIVLGLIGDHSTEELKQAGTAAFASPEFRPGMSIVVDARSSFNDASHEDMQSRMEWLVSLRTKGISRHCAVVGTKDRIGMTMLIAARANALGMKVRVFTNLEEALSWLRLRRHIH
jgi:hypothetical protein